MITVGHAGGDVRSDVRISVDASSRRELIVKSTVQSMYGRSIQQLADNALARRGHPALRLEIEDSGALPFALEARLEAALDAALGQPASPSEALGGAPPPRERLRRTRLYVPGNTPKFMPNADLYRPDGIILDLEDSVPDLEKTEARYLVVSALRSLDWHGVEKMVRINANCPEDLEAVGALAETILIPKVEDPGDVIDVSEHLERLGSPALIVPIIESARGVSRAEAIASASPRVVGLTVGLEDYTADLGAQRSEEGLECLWALSQVVNAARAAGVQPLASVCPVLDDDAYLQRYTVRMRALGFEGVGCIHPSQVRVVHHAMTPSEQEVQEAMGVVEAYEHHGGATRLGMRMIDAPAYVRAKKTLAMAEAPK